jgi:hypothetical protein
MNPPIEGTLNGRGHDIEYCVYCEEPIEVWDMLPERMAKGRAHRECAFRMVVGSVAHQKGICACHGGDEEESPGLTLRQGARLAWNYANRGRTEEN